MPVDVKIKLVSSRIRSLAFTVKEGRPEKGEMPIRYEMSYGYEYDYKEKLIHTLITISTGKNQLPFILNIEYEGVFRINKRVAKKNIIPFAEINCPAILFPFIRECIADITRRAGFNPLLLPAVNFVELARRQKEGKNQKS
jgi:preprotein translocase subunit SecB